MHRLFHPPLSGLLNGLAAALLLPLGSLFANERPNFILILADDQGYGDMGYTGHPHLKTPHFDAMAEQALRFDNFHSSHPVCSPTRAAILTGRDPNRQGCHTWGGTLRDGETTFAHLLGRAGYHTGHFGKWHVGSVLPEGSANPGQAGFERWISGPNFYENNPTLADQGVATAYRGESSMLTIDLALEWIDSLPRHNEDDQAPPARPFVAVVWFGSPHSPWISSPELLEPYQNLNLTKAQANFLGEVTGMDRAVGHLNAVLEEKGLADNTVVWFTSDNGALPKVGSAGPYRGNKSQVWQGGLRVPALLKWPRVVDSPAALDFPASTNDIFPTVLELAGVDLPDDQRPLDGTSLAPWIRRPGTDRAPDRGIGAWKIDDRGVLQYGERLMQTLLEAGNDLEKVDPDTRTNLLRRDAESGDPTKPADFREGHAAWLRDQWKLHRIFGDDGKVYWLLFDLSKDPGETNDVSESHPDVLASMRAELEAWQASVIEDLNHP